MGLVILMMWVGTLVVLGLPCLILSLVVGARAQRAGAFWLAFAAALVVSVLGQYLAISWPFLRKGTYSWDFVVASMFGWHLLAPAVLAGFTGIAARGFRRAVPAGVVSGLLLSMTLSIGLAVPLMFVLPGLLGLRVEP